MKIKTKVESFEFEFKGQCALCGRWKVLEKSPLGFWRCRPCNQKVVSRPND